MRRLPTLTPAHARLLAAASGSAGPFAITAGGRGIALWAASSATLVIVATLARVA